MVEHTPVRAALYGGDDVTDLDAFDALDALAAVATSIAVKVGVRSDEGPAAIVERADLVVDGVRGLHRRPLRRWPVRFTDFLRTAVLLFGGAGTALAVVAIAGASADDDTVAIARGRGLVDPGRRRRALAGPPDGPDAGHRAPARRRPRHQHAARARAGRGALQPPVAARRCSRWPAARWRS